jgi:hypothetical protein
MAQFAGIADTMVPQNATDTSSEGKCGVSKMAIPTLGTLRNLGRRAGSFRRRRQYEVTTSHFEGSFVSFLMV